LPRIDQRQALADAEAMAFDRGDNIVLCIVGQHAQRVGQRWPERAGVDAALRRGRQLGSQRQADRNPVLLACGGLGDTNDREPILSQCLRDAGLVHRGHRATWGVRGQHGDLGIARARLAFDHHGDRRCAGRAPARESLEAINHFETITITCGTDG
jgi:hypothetical protein